MPYRWDSGCRSEVFLHILLRGNDNLLSPLIPSALVKLRNMVTLFEQSLLFESLPCKLFAWHKKALH